MREKLAYVETIKALKPISGADKIECAEVLGWECVTTKGQFRVGDKIIFCEVDCVMPDLEPFAFLRDRKFRIRTIRLRSQISQGLVLPLSVINEVDPNFDISKLHVGDDVTEVLRITKYDPEVATDIAPEPPEKTTWIIRHLRWLKWKLFGFKPMKRGDFPTHLVPKTDEMRVQHMQNALIKNEGKSIYITEKCDGSSFTAIFYKRDNWLAKLFGKDCVFQICTRNRILYSTDKNGNVPEHSFMSLANKYKLLEGMKKLGRNIAIQGECIGPKWQGNVYKLPECDLRIFSIYDIDKQAYLPYDDMVAIIIKLNLRMVPLIGYGSIKISIPYYVELSKGKSILNPKINREGVVCRAIDSTFSFKSISPDYLLWKELKADK
jgi:hypothetical protein